MTKEFKYARITKDKNFDGYLNYNSLKDLSNELMVSDRHLRGLFIENLGVPPIRIAKYHRALFAKKLLMFSDQSVTDIAFASGFGSIRQFNQVFKEISLLKTYQRNPPWN